MELFLSTVDNNILKSYILYVHIVQLLLGVDVGLQVNNMWVWVYSNFFLRLLMNCTFYNFHDNFDTLL